jgi:threonylcarbamoyladenosine tRNA methylthiotransferase MtaB
MGRPYRRPDIEDIFKQLVEGAGRMAIGTDLIVGFPAETESAFAETYALIEKVLLTYLHVFPYSPRQGTVAASWPDRVPATEKKMRAKQLADLGRTKHNEFAQANVGLQLKVLIETKKEIKGEGVCWFGHSRNYLPVIIPISESMKQFQAGDEITVISKKWENGRLRAEKI